MFSVCAMTSGQRKLFHWNRNVRIASVASAGPVSGSTMRVKIRTSLAPSIRAASMSESGMSAMNWRIRNTPSGVTKKGRIRPQCVFARPRLLTVTNSGTKVAIPGMTSISRTRKKRKFFPAKSIFANA